MGRDVELFIRGIGEFHELIGIDHLMDFKLGFFIDSFFITLLFTIPVCYTWPFYFSHSILLDFFFVFILLQQS